MVSRNRISFIIVRLHQFPNATSLLHSEFTIQTSLLSCIRSLLLVCPWTLHQHATVGTCKQEGDERTARDIIDKCKRSFNNCYECGSNDHKYGPVLFVLTLKAPRIKIKDLQISSNVGDVETKQTRFIGFTLSTCSST